MKVFISSLISGFEPFREAARAAIRTLRHEPIAAEDFGARPASPQITCLQGIRSADLVVLILGDRYGSVQGSSGVSPTHEEYLEARDTKAVLVFIQQGVTREPQQTKFIDEVQAWQSGHYRKGFTTAEELKELVLQGLHDHLLAHAAGPLDRAALTDAAVALLPDVARRNAHSGVAMLNVAVAGGPSQRILRPAQLEDQALVEQIHRQALFGDPRLFEATKGMASGIAGDALWLEQGGGARIQLDEHGALLLRVPLQQSQSSLQRQHGFMAAVIEEAVTRQLAATLAFADWMLETIDPTQRIAHVAIAASIAAGDFMPWRTQAEQDASPTSMTLGTGGQDRPPVRGDWPRPALRIDAHGIAQDITVRLRRCWKTR